MKLLVIGSGGREDATVSKLAESEHAEMIYCAPGSAGIGRRRLAKNGALTECVSIKADDISGLVTFAKSQSIGLTVVGPELPLGLGIVDRFQKDGLRIFGPNQRAAQFELSKVFSDLFMRDYGIAKPMSRIAATTKAALAFAEELEGQCVVKADGPAAGKGALVCHDMLEAGKAISDVLVRRTFGNAGNMVVIQKRLTGKEISLHLLSDGRTVKYFPLSQDHKQLHNGKKAPNTGGMGTSSLGSPGEILERLPSVHSEIIEPWMQGCLAEGIDYKGLLYPGIMLTDHGPKVLEFNARFGDPETQVYMPRLENDLVEVLDACVSGTLDLIELVWKPIVSVCVVLASEGYPERAPQMPWVIDGLEEAGKMENVKIFHAGTSFSEGRWYATGGRVLGVTAWAEDLGTARGIAYSAVDKIKFRGMQFREDISFNMDLD